MLARVPAGDLIDRTRHEPKLRAAEVLHSDTAWRPCTVLAWARHRDAWAVLIRWRDGHEDWREYDPRHIRPSDGPALGRRAYGRPSRRHTARRHAARWDAVRRHAARRGTAGRGTVRRDTARRRAADRGIQYRAGQCPQRCGDPGRATGSQVVEDWLAVQGAEHQVGDHVSIEVGPLRRDERADVTVPEPVDRVLNEKRHTPRQTPGRRPCVPGRLEPRGRVPGRVGVRPGRLGVFMRLGLADCGYAGPCRRGWSRWWCRRR